jgi:beta-glucosidase
VQAVYWNNTTFQEPNIAVRNERRPAFDNGPIAWFAMHPEVKQPPTGAQAVSFSGLITAPTSGEYRLSLSGHLDLGTNQDELIEAVAKANPNTIVALQSGGPVLMPWLNKVKGVLQLYYGGAEQGNVLADVLFGRVNPSGKLPISYPATEAQPTEALGIEASLLHSEEGDVHLTDGVNVGYRGYAAAGEDPLFPFGYGLSYTSYRYRDLATAVDDGTVKVSFTIRNQGTRRGAEIAQVYAGKLPTTVATPVTQLAGWAKVDLQPKERKRVSVELACKSLAHWDAEDGKCVMPAGPVNLSVGASSADTRLEGRVRLPGGTCSEESDLAMNGSLSK